MSLNRLETIEQKQRASLEHKTQFFYTPLIK